MVITIAIILGVLFLIAWVIAKGIRQTQHEYKKIKTSDTRLGENIRESEVFINSNLTKLKKGLQKNISKSLVTGCSWLLLNEMAESVVYTFRNSGELLITTNGQVEKCFYEFITDNNSLLITKGGVTEHFNILNSKDDFLFLNKLSTDVVLLFANQTKFKDELKVALRREAKIKFNEEAIR